MSGVRVLHFSKDFIQIYQYHIQWKLDIKSSDITKYLTQQTNFSVPNELISFVLYCLLTSDITKYLI